MKKWNHTGAVRRIDLNLRAFYPELSTQIYELSDNKYLIHCENLGIDFEKLKENFHNSIRFITTPVDISIDKPNNFLKLIDNISDKDISKGFEGILMNKAELLNTLMAKFPSVNFYKISDDKGVISIYTASFEEKIENENHLRFLNSRDKQRITEFLDGLNWPVEFNLIEERLREKPVVEDYPVVNKVLFIYAASLKRELKTEYALRDEALWFDNIDNIFQGKFGKNNLYFYSPDEYCCYVDYSLFGNIDIRNLLFLFQVIYLTPPYEKELLSWLKEAKITKNEFFDLISKGRIKLILSQYEYRYDVNFINEVYTIRNDAVITRRALSVLQQIDIVDLANSYLFNSYETIKELRVFCQLSGELFKVNPQFMYEMLVWPIKALRHSFDTLNHAGILAMSSFGVNHAIAKNISSAINKDVELEFMISSPAIHLASSLNATYFPFRAKDGFSDSVYANVMGELLNFYKYANPANITGFINGKQKISSGVLPISPIELIEVNEYISITELESILSKDVVYPNSKRLIETLAELPEDKRSERIELYNLEVNRKLAKKGKGNEFIDLGTNAAMDIAGVVTGFQFVGSVFSVLKTGGKRIAQTLPMIKNITAKIEEAYYQNPDKANIHYLAKINRAAQIKRFK